MKWSSDGCNAKLPDLPLIELPPLREVIQRHGLAARKSLGQNFLLDLNLTGRIARAAGSLEGVQVIEIGPGPGGLTRALLSQGALVTAIERDERCLAALEEVAAAWPGRLTLVPGDALDIDPAALTPAPRKIVANLPYNIATPLLLRWMGNIGAYESLTLMFQKEVAERITASPRSRDYGRLSIAVQWLATARSCFDIPARAFVPPPKITSTVVQIVARPRPVASCDLTTLERVTAAAFGQRRKMLRQSLRGLGVDTDSLMAKAGILPTSRAEELSVEDFCTLACALERTAKT